jgi:polysaccharide pyruvyl transferase WcaK-like protein
MSVWHPTEIRPTFDFTDRYICISGGSGFGHGKEDSEKISKIVQSLLDKDIDANILLVAPAQHDEHILLRVAESFSLPLAKVNNNSLVGASIIGNSELYLGGRWHGSIFALLNGTRLINFEANTFKMRALKQMVRSDHPILSTDNLASQVDEISKLAINELNREDTRSPRENLREMQYYAKENIACIGDTNE